MFECQFTDFEHILGLFVLMRCEFDTKENLSYDCDWKSKQTLISYKQRDNDGMNLVSMSLRSIRT